MLSADIVTEVRETLVTKWLLQRGQLHGKRLTLPCLRSHEDICPATDASKLSRRTLVCDGEAFAVKLLQSSGSAVCRSPAIAIGCCQRSPVAAIRQGDIVQVADLSRQRK